MASIAEYGFDSRELNESDVAEYNIPKMFFLGDNWLKKDTLKIIAVSAINSNLEILNTLTKYLTYNSITNVDLVVCTGGLVNLDDSCEARAYAKASSMTSQLGTCSTVACQLEKIICNVDICAVNVHLYNPWPDAVVPARPS